MVMLECSWFEVDRAEEDLVVVVAAIVKPSFLATGLIELLFHLVFVAEASRPSNPTQERW
jgi:hypothetical protein